MASILPNDFKRALLQAIIDDSATLKMMLLDANHVPNPDTDIFIDDISVNEIAPVLDYSAGGKAVANVAAAADNVNNRGELTFDDVVWNAAGSNGEISAAYAILYDDTGIPGTSRILAEYELNGGALLTATNAPFTVEDDPNDGGIGIA